MLRTLGRDDVRIIQQDEEEPVHEPYPVAGFRRKVLSNRSLNVIVELILASSKHSSANMVLIS